MKGRLLAVLNNLEASTHEETGSPVFDKYQISNAKTIIDLIYEQFGDIDIDIVLCPSVDYDIIFAINKGPLTNYIIIDQAPNTLFLGVSSTDPQYHKVLEIGDDIDNPSELVKMFIEPIITA